MDSFSYKYIKYKKKYIHLKNLLGGKLPYCDKILDDDIENVKNAKSKHNASKLLEILEKIKIINKIIHDKIILQNGDSKILQVNEIKIILNTDDKEKIHDLYNQLYDDFIIHRHIFFYHNYSSLLLLLKIYNYYDIHNQTYILGDSLYKLTMMNDLINNKNSNKSYFN